MGASSRAGDQTSGLSGAAGETAQAILEALEEPAVLIGPGEQVEHLNRAARSLLSLTSNGGVPSVEQWRTLNGRLAPVEDSEPQGEPGGSSARRLAGTGFPKRVYLLTSRPVRSSDCELGRLETLRNITESVRAAQERERLETRHVREIAALEARVEQAESFKMELTANVTHDLRTPLASIKASVSGLLAEDIEYDPAALRETLSLIEEETDRLQRRVSNLLSMAKMESGESVVHRDWLDIADLIASSLESLRSVRNERRVELHVPDDVPMVFADYDQVQIAVRNLIENAFLYSPADQPVEVNVTESLGQLRVRVRDYGQGLMPDEFERVFEKFYRGRSARKIPGTGLGLPICRAIAQAHGGNLWVEHVPGGGVAFVFSIPLTEESPDFNTEGHG